MSPCGILYKTIVPYLIGPQITLVLASAVALASAYPRPDVGNPFLSISINRPGQSSVQTDVSKQAVSIRQTGEYVLDQGRIVKNRYPGKSILGDYFQENMTS